MDHNNAHIPRKKNSTMIPKMTKMSLTSKAAKKADLNSRPKLAIVDPNVKQLATKQDPSAPPPKPAIARGVLNKHSKITTTRGRVAANAKNRPPATKLPEKRENSTKPQSTSNTSTTTTTCLRITTNLYCTKSKNGTNTTRNKETCTTTTREVSRRANSKATTTSLNRQEHPADVIPADKHVALKLQRGKLQHTTTSRETEWSSLLPDVITDLAVLDLSCLPDVESLSDPDFKDRDDPQLCSEYVKEIYEHLLLTEKREEFRIREDLMLNQTEIDVHHRKVLLDWLVQVHTRYNLLPDTLHICLDIIDRYLQKENVSKKELQLVGVTAMFVASKYEEIFPSSVTDFAYITADTYTSEDIIKKERDILSKLNYELGRPNPLIFLRRYSKLMGTTTQIHNLAKYFIEASYLSTDCRKLLPSQTAVGALLLAARILSKRNQSELWGCFMEQYTWYSEKRASIFMKEVLRQVCSYYQLCCSNPRYISIKEKYSNGFHHVAALPRLQSKLESL